MNGGDRFLPVRTSDGIIHAMGKLQAPKSTGDRFIVVRSADGTPMAVKCAAVSAEGQRGIPVMLADGKASLVRFEAVEGCDNFAEGDQFHYYSRIQSLSNVEPSVVCANLPYDDADDLPPDSSDTMISGVLTYDSANKRFVGTCSRRQRYVDPFGGIHDIFDDVFVTHQLYCQYGLSDYQSSEVSGCHPFFSAWIYREYTDWNSYQTLWFQNGYATGTLHEEYFFSGGDGCTGSSMFWGCAFRSMVGPTYDGFQLYGISASEGVGTNRSWLSMSRI